MLRRDDDDGRRVLEFVEAQPGVRMLEVARETGLPSWAAHTLLDALVKAERLDAREQGSTRLYYPVKGRPRP